MPSIKSVHSVNSKNETHKKLPFVHFIMVIPKAVLYCQSKDNVREVLSHLSKVSRFLTKKKKEQGLQICLGKTSAFNIVRYGDSYQTKCRTIMS
jgi:hypothetical protein